MTGGAPRVSFVVGSRNDDHGGDPRRRTELFVHGLAALAARVGLAAELVIVEWNPPPRRIATRDALAWPRGPGPLAIRCVDGAARGTSRIANADRLAFFQMIAKNVGIRRARGEFVVATNIDLLFSEELIWFLERTAPFQAQGFRTRTIDASNSEFPGLDDFWSAPGNLLQAQARLGHRDIPGKRHRLQCAAGSDIRCYHGLDGGRMHGGEVACGHCDIDLTQGQVGMLEPACHLQGSTARPKLQLFDGDAVTSKNEVHLDILIALTGGNQLQHTVM